MQAVDADQQDVLDFMTAVVEFVLAELAEFALGLRASRAAE